MKYSLTFGNAAAPGQLGRLDDLLVRQALVDHVAHALAARLGRQRDRARAAANQRLDQERADAVDAQRRQRHLGADRRACAPGAARAAGGPRSPPKSARPACAAASRAGCRPSGGRRGGGGRAATCSRPGRSDSRGRSRASSRSGTCRRARCRARSPRTWSGSRSTLRAFSRATGSARSAASGSTVLDRAVGSVADRRTSPGRTRRAAAPAVDLLPPVAAAEEDLLQARP